MEDTPPDSPPIVSIVGPTAIGKSAMAVELAKQFNGEIISADSRQVYRLLDIGTAKPSREEQALVRHHIIDVAYPDDQYTSAIFRDQGRAVLSSIASRNKVAFLVGGTGHYIRILLEESTVPRVPPNQERRRRIESRIVRYGIHSVIREIDAIDPATARRIDVSNPRRVVRAMEIIEVTGMPIPPLTTRRLPTLMLGLNTDRRELYQIADARVDRQMDDGLLDETQSLVGLGYSLDLPPLRGLAYRQMGLHITGHMGLAEAVHAYKSATHQLIRRQLTWFRSEPNVHWIDPYDSTAKREAAERISEFIKDGPQVQSENVTTVRATGLLTRK